MRTGTMSKSQREELKQVMSLAWQMVKKNGMSMGDAMRTAWKNIKLRAKMYAGIVKFYFQKVDGTIREAYGTLKAEIIGERGAESGKRKPNDTIQTYFDTEKEEFRCFKKANLFRIG